MTTRLLVTETSESIGVWVPMVGRSAGEHATLRQGGMQEAATDIAPILGVALAHDDHVRGHTQVT